MESAGVMAGEADSKSGPEPPPSSPPPPLSSSALPSSSSLSSSTTTTTSAAVAKGRVPAGDSETKHADQVVVSSSPELSKKLENPASTVHALQGELRQSLNKSFVKWVDLLEWKMGDEVVGAGNEKVVMYRLSGKSDLFCWTFWVRFQHLTVLHEQLRLSRENSAVLRESLPPFPSKRLKLFVDHSNPFFVSARFALIRNFLRKTFGTSWIRKQPLYVGFITPGRHAVQPEIWRADELNRPADLDKPHPEGFLGSSRIFHSAWSLIQNGEAEQLDNKDEGDDSLQDYTEFQSIRVPHAYVVHGNHVVFQVEVTPASANDLAEEPPLSKVAEENSKVESKKNEVGSKPVISELSWVVLKRYSEFVQLDAMLDVDPVVKKLRSLVPNAVLPPLPQKELKLFVDHLDSPFVEKRRVLLELYLQELISIPCVRCCKTLLDFLGVRE